MYDLLKSFSQAGTSMDEWYNQVQKKLELCNYPQNVANIRPMDNKLEKNNAINRHMKIAIG